MKLNKIIATVLLAFITMLSYAQSEYEMKPNEKYTQIDFLSSYYSQDGDNAAVTGGVGTEELTDFANIILINAPLDSTKSINATLGMDIYSSASTDNIDKNRSSASSQDARTYGNLGYVQKNLKRAWTYGARIGFSSEYDYTSVNGGINLAKELNRGNTEIAFTGQAFFDNWKTYFPEELRRDVSVPTKSRKSYNGQLTLSQVVNQRVQLSVSVEAIYMDGLLSTPFHRVYFAEQGTPDIERLPSTRLKIPLALRVNYKPTDNLILRTYYRYYTDDFGIDAHTFSLELPYHIGEKWTVSPFYRFHTQTASDYFSPFAQHHVTDEYYTSDYDLSELTSTKFGLGVEYSPLYGVARMKIPFANNVLKLNSISMRASRYSRSTGLDAMSMALGINFRL